MVWSGQRCWGGVSTRLNGRMDSCPLKNITLIRLLKARGMEWVPKCCKNGRITTGWGLGDGAVHQAASEAHPILFKHSNKVNVNLILQIRNEYERRHKEATFWAQTETRKYKRRINKIPKRPKLKSERKGTSWKPQQEICSILMFRWLNGMELSIQ